MTDDQNFVMMSSDQLSSSDFDVINAKNYCPKIIYNADNIIKKNLTLNPGKSDQHLLRTDCHSHQSRMVSLINGRDQSICSNLVHSSSEFQDTSPLICEDNVTNANSSTSYQVIFSFLTF